MPFGLSAFILVSLASLVATPVGLPDRGVFRSLDGGVETTPPSWVATEGARLLADRARGVLTLVLAGEPVKAYPIRPSCRTNGLDCLGLRPSDRAELRAALHVADASLPGAIPTLAAAFRDTDQDGVADAVDILLGAKKTVLLASAYKETAPKIAYPGGDVPRELGVCTDVIVRALRNAGVDLQKEIFEDAGRAPRAYPGIAKRNPNIDHRRVRNLAAYFERHWRAVTETGALLPGDVVLLDTFPGRAGPDHIGVVSDRLGKSGLPLIINAWTDGYVTQEMDLLGFVPMTGAYRAPAPGAPGPPARAVGESNARAPGDAGSGISVPASTRQLVLVSTDDWSASSGSLSVWQRGARGRWTRRWPPTAVMLGRAGLGWGTGVHAPDVIRMFGGPEKREGDGRSPAGIFRLSEATGYEATPPPGTRLPYRRATEALRCVDDPGSPSYERRPREPRPRGHRLKI